MSRGPLQLHDSISFRVPRDVGDRIRQEAYKEREHMGDVARRYLLAGLSAAEVLRPPTGSPDGGRAA